jgi:uncharacterized membrane protein
MSEMSSVFEVGFLSFSDEDAATALAEQLRAGGATHKVNDVSVLEHKASGKFSVHAYSDERTKGQGVAGGAVVGSLVGALLLGPFGLLAGLVGGAAVGATVQGRDPRDLELNDEFVAELRASLPPGSSGLLIVGEPEPVEELMGSVHASGVVVAKAIRHPLTDAQAAAINAAIVNQQGGA